METPAAAPQLNLAKPSDSSSEPASLAVVPPATADGEAAPSVGLFKKLAEVMVELDEVALDKKHENQGWKYASTDSVLRAIREPLRKRGVLVLSSTRGEPVERQFNTRSGVSVVTTVGLTFTFVDSDSGFTWSADWHGAGADSGEKGLAKAITVGLRTFLRDQFLLPDGEDHTAEGGGGGTRGKNEAGEKLASGQQLNEINTLASGRLSGREFLALLHAVRELPAPESALTEEEAIALLPAALHALTTKQAVDAIAKLKKLPTGSEASS